MKKIGNMEETMETVEIKEKMGGERGSKEGSRIGRGIS